MNSGSGSRSPYLRYVSYRLEALFSRGNDGWGSRSFAGAAQALEPFIESGRLRLTMCAIPPLPAKTEKQVASWAHARESAAHMVMKHAARRWMRQSGARDAEEEYPGFGGRFDVYSVKADWMVEVGNSDIGKLISAILKPGRPRFTLIPYQRLALRPGVSRRLIGIDFVWQDDLRADLDAAILAQRNAGR